jgi:hypothetical protein
MGGPSDEGTCDGGLIEAADLDEALAMAEQIPVPFGGVEVRPVRVFD